MKDPREGLPSASGVERLVLCPASRRVEAGLPDEETPIAASGTRIHSALETGDDEALDTQEHEVAERLRKMADRALREFLADYQVSDTTPLERLKEERMWIVKRRTGERLASAQVDVAYVANEEAALIIDYKSGFLSARQAARNWQLRTQALALWHTRPSIETIRVTICQFRLREEYHFADYTIGDLHHAQYELEHALWRAGQEDAQRIPGKHCSGCRARGRCPDAAAWAVFYPVELARLVDTAQTEWSLSKEQLAHIHGRRKTADAIFAQAEKQLRALDEAQLNSVGLTRKENSPMRVIKSATDLYNILAAEKLCDAKEFMSWCKVGIGKMEKAIVPRMAQKHQISQENAKPALGALLEQCITKKSKEPSIETL